MTTHKTVGTPHEEQNPQANYLEPGIETEREVLADAAAKRDTDRPAGKPFTIEAPKNYPRR
jgi:hypothetical protein